MVDSPIDMVSPRSRDAMLLYVLSFFVERKMVILEEDPNSNAKTGLYNESSLHAGQQESSERPYW